MDVNSSLLTAVCNGRLERARELIDTFGLSYSKEWENGCFLLILALENKHADIAELLLSKGSTVNSVKRHANSPIHLAARNGDIKIVEMILNKNARIDDKDQDGSTPLHLAAPKGYQEITTMLLAKGADVNAKTEDGSTPLHLAAKTSYKEIIILLLTKGAVINAKDKNGCTPLLLALKSYGYFDKCDREPVAELLLQHGAKVDILDEAGKSVLYLAVEKGFSTVVEYILKECPDINNLGNESLINAALVRYGEKYEKIVDALLKYGFTVNPEDTNSPRMMGRAVAKGDLKIVQHLLKSGVDVNTCDSICGFTPLQIAVTNLHKEVVKLLISFDADINASDIEGRTALHSTVLDSNMQSLDGNKDHDIIIRGEIAKLLLSKGANVDAKTKSGDTTLHVAIESGCAIVVEALLEYNPSINAVNIFGLTSLHLAIRKGYQEITKMLLEKGADVNAKEEAGSTPLYLAIINGYQEIITMLLEKGADVNDNVNIGCCKKTHNPEYVNVYNKSLYPTPLHLAAKKGYQEIVTMLLSYGADVNPKNVFGPRPLHIAVEKGHQKIVTMLLEKGADVNAKNLHNGFKPLHLAVQEGYQEIVTMLLSYGADVNVEADDGTTPLHLAVENGYQEIITMLLAKGADLNATRKDGSIPLHLAAQEGYQEIVTMLLLYGADVNVKNKDGTTPLHLAVENCYQEIIKLLLEKGADVNVKDEEGTTPLHLSTEDGCQEIITMLLEKGADVNAKKENGTTPLHLAVQYCHHDIIETMLKFGADITSRGEKSRTVLFFAFENRDVNMVQTVLKHGCDIAGVDIPYCRGTSEVDEVESDYEDSYSDDSIDIQERNLGRKTNCYYGSDSSYEYYEDYEDIYPSRDSYCETRQVKITMVQQHIVQMLAANLYLSKQQLNSVADIVKNEMRDFFSECKEEIENMKREKVNNTNISFYDVLATTANSLAIYLNNENVVQVLKSENYEKKFPMYASMIKCNFRKGMERKELLEQGNQIFHLFINNFAELPRECTEKICSFLSNKDIRILIIAFKPLRNSSSNIDHKGNA